MLQIYMYRDGPPGAGPYLR